MPGAFTGAVLAATRFPPVRAAFTRTSAGLALAHRFVAGKTLAEGLAAARELNQHGIRTSLDHLGEEVGDPAACRSAQRVYLDCIEQIAQQGIDGNISVKLTQLGMGVDDELAGRQLKELAAAAADAGMSVSVDMEDSRWTETTVRLYSEAQQESGNLGLAIQACLHRSAADVAALASLGGHIRLCKGAYAEPSDVAMQSKEAVDANFALLMSRLMAEEDCMPAIATHDERLVEIALILAQGRTNYFEFQMLHGVRQPLQRRLVEAGQRLRVYVPYGSQWYPYLTRRLAERPANVSFFLRALFGG
jgi:proline dehydrogenase